MQLKFWFCQFYGQCNILCCAICAFLWPMPIGHNPENGWLLRGFYVLLRVREDGSMNAVVDGLNSRHVLYNV